MSWVSCPNNSPMLRSCCLSSGIAASRSAFGAGVAVTASHRSALLDAGATAVGLVGSGIPKAPFPTVLPAIAVPATAAPLGALQEPGANQAKHECASNHDGGLPTREVLQILTHGSRILVSEIVGNLVERSEERRVGKACR